MSDAERPLWELEESVEARAEPGFAFKYLTNVDDMAADPGINRVETDGPYRVGMRGKTYLTRGGTTDWIVTAVEPDRRFVIDMALRDERGTPLQGISPSACFKVRSPMR